ncbi:hypothetical protein Tco_0418285 [Tanacetum coccineum]
MRTRNSYFPNNSNVTIPRRRNKGRAPNIVEPELRTIVAPMAERTMEELLRAPTEGYGEAIVLPEINADHFEIKTNLLQLVQANPFYGRESENPHAHINSFKRITSTLRFRNVQTMMNTTSRENVSKTDERIDKLADQLSTLVEIVSKKAVTPAQVKSHSVMSDSDESGVTHTEVSSPFEDLSDIGSPRADDHEYLELPYMPEDPYLEAALQAPPSPDYVPGPEEPEQAPLSPDYVPGPEHADDEIVAEDQPYAEDASPTAQSPDYVPETDPEADPEEDDDEDPEEDPIDYPADGGDDGDDEMDIEEDEDDDMDIDADEEDEDDEMDVEVDEEAEEEHPAPAYPVVVALPATAPSAEETEPFETDESAATPPPHLHYRHMIARPVEPPTMPTSAPTSLPPLLLPSASRREDRPKVNLPPRERLGIALGPSYEVGESSATAAARPTGGLRADYGFVATMDREIRRARFSTGHSVGAHREDFESMGLGGHDEITRMLDNELRMSREAWGKSMDASDLARAEVMSLCTTVLAQMVHMFDALHGPSDALRGRILALQGLRGKKTPLGVMISQSWRGGFGVVALFWPHVMQLGMHLISHSWGHGRCRGAERVARRMHLPGVHEVRPLYFKGTEEWVSLTQWFEEWSTVFE